MCAACLHAGSGLRLWVFLLASVTGRGQIGLACATSEMSEMKIGLLQLNLTVGDFDGNAAKIVTAVRRAAADGADLCVASELALWGYPA